jgi:hypothetical protein
VVPKIIFDAATQHVGDRLRTAFVRDARDLRAGDDLERLAQDLRQRSQPETEIELARIGFRVGDEFRDGRGRDRRRDHQHLRAVRQHGHRHEAPRVVVEVLIEREREDEARRPDEQRIPVGLGARRHLGSERRAGARPVVDDDALPEASRGLLGDDARQHIDRRSRRVGHDQLDRLDRIALRIGRRRANRKHHCRKSLPARHVRILRVPAILEHLGLNRYRRAPVA